jgi:hypothetical protein
MRSRWSLTVVLITLAATNGPASRIAAQEPDFPHWPFDEDSYASRELDDAPSADESWYPGARLREGWPRVDVPRNGFLARRSDPQRDYVLGQNRPTALQFVVNTPQRMAGRFRSMWNRSVELLTFGRRSSQVTRGQSTPRRPLFGRLFSGGEVPEQGPRTVSEWMSQDRLD